MSVQAILVKMVQLAPTVMETTGTAVIVMMDGKTQIAKPLSTIYCVTHNISHKYARGFVKICFTVGILSYFPVIIMITLMVMEHPYGIRTCALPLCWNLKSIQKVYWK